MCKGISFYQFSKMNHEDISIFMTVSTNDAFQDLKTCLNNYLVEDSYDEYDLDDEKWHWLKVSQDILNRYGWNDEAKRFINSFWQKSWRNDVSDTSRGVKRALAYLGL